MKTKIAINRDIYDVCQLFMSSIGYEGITYESVLNNKILKAHYYLVGCIAMARIVHDKHVAEVLVRSFYQSIDEETFYSLCPLSYLLGHLLNINAKDAFDYIAEKGEQKGGSRMKMKIAINRDIYDRCQLFMSSIGYEGITYESVLGSKILTAHYYLVGCLAMARFVDDKHEAEDLVGSFYQSIDEETFYSLLPLSHLLGRLFNINAKDAFDYIAEKGGSHD